MTRSVLLGAFLLSTSASAQTMNFGDLNTSAGGVNITNVAYQIAPNERGKSVSSFDESSDIGKCVTQQTKALSDFLRSPDTRKALHDKMIGNIHMEYLIATDSSSTEQASTMTAVSVYTETDGLTRAIRLTPIVTDQGKCMLPDFNTIARMTGGTSMPLKNVVGQQLKLMDALKQLNAVGAADPKSASDQIKTGTSPGGDSAADAQKSAPAAAAQGQ